MQSSYDRTFDEIGRHALQIRKRPILTLLIIFTLVLGIGAGNSEVHKNMEADRRCSSIELESHVRFLSSDALKGRAPGTAGGETAALYIAKHFHEIGLQPGLFGYLQPVPLQALRTDPKNSILRFAGLAGTSEIHLYDGISVSTDLL